MQVRHLLMMATGHDQDATGPTTNAKDGDWVKAFLALPIQREPGTHFVYNSAATYMLSAIVQCVMGKSVLDFLKPLLFGPIGIDSPTWETCPKGINCGGWGLSIKTEDIARFGQLYLQKGKWAGNQIVPQAWVTDATSPKISNGNPADASDWSQGYCYQFWRCRHGAFRGDGAFGQFCIVMPDQDAVLAITSGVNDMQAILDAAWDKLLPGISAVAIQTKNRSILQQKLEEQDIKPRQAGASSRVVSVPKRRSGLKFRMEPNSLNFKLVTLNLDGERGSALLNVGTKIYRLHWGLIEWVKGTGIRAKPTDVLPGLVSNKTAGKGDWVADRTYEVTLCYYETPFIDTLIFKFTGDRQITISVKTNVGFGPTTHPDIVGSMV
jgi:hypothetical protein